MALKGDGVSREFKSAPFTMLEKAAGDDDRTVTGIVAVHGNIDGGLDRSHPGAFAKTISEGRNRAKHLWNHRFSDPPTAKILELKELSAKELPAAVKEYAPEATGGLQVKRRYLETPRGDEMLHAVKEGAVNEMSYGYSPVKYDFETIGEGDAAQRVRNLREVKLFDTSDVLWGMNDSTLAAIGKALDAQDLPLEAVLAAIKSLSLDVKEGRRNASGDVALIKSIHEAVVGLEPTICGSEKQAETGDDQSRAADEEALIKAAALSQALTLAKARMQLENFNL